MTSHKNNIDEDVVNDFGEEWKKFDQGTKLSLEENNIILMTTFLSFLGINYQIMR